jgi:2-polyprenyl-3-methyl-5-hydroxy-6-metoxy-1,4-benzoquinol methylase
MPWQVRQVFLRQLHQYIGKRVNTNMTKTIIQSKSLYVGCGEDRREGFIHCDTVGLPGVDVVCDAWEVSSYLSDLETIYSRHMLEHLTSMEADAALLDWHHALKIGGKIYLVVSNLDFHIQQWLSAEWNDDTIKDKNSDARYGFAGLYGWQRECNPKLDDYNQSHWDIHKSGYNEKRLRYLLQRAGFINIELEVKGDVHLVAQAEKSMSKGERQISPELKGIREDHRNRYAFAAKILAERRPNNILDLACGIGYGSKMLADKISCPVTAVDIDNGAIEYARTHYQGQKIQHICADARSLEFDHSFDAIVSFETIEHIDFDEQLINKFYQLLSPGGTFICSTPNQDVMPFDKEKFKYHVRHYTVSEIGDLITRCGFSIVTTHTQKDPRYGQVEPGTDGCFTILVCEKPESSL